MKRKVNRVGGYAWMLAEEAAALLKVLKEGGTREVRYRGKPKTLVLEPQPEAWALVSFMLHTGCRLYEAYGLKWGDVDVEARTIRLCGGSPGVAMKPLKARVIPMLDPLFLLFDFLPRGASDEPVFREDGKLREILRRAYAVADLPDYQVPAFRDTCASHLVIQGVPLEAVARLLGCKWMTMAKRYGHLVKITDEDLAKAAASASFGCSEDAPASEEDVSGS